MKIAPHIPEISQYITVHSYKCEYCPENSIAQLENPHLGTIYIKHEISVKKSGAKNRHPILTSKTLTDSIQNFKRRR